MVSIEDLSEEQLNSLLENPEVVKSLEYEEENVFDVSDHIKRMSNEWENYDVFTQAIADRSGRVTKQTVEKVLRGLVEEADEYQN